LVWEHICRVALFLLLLAPHFVVTNPAHAAEIAVGNSFDQPTIVIGKTSKLSIFISNPGPNSIRSTRFQCFSEGTSAVGASISQLPTVIAANSVFRTEQYYRGVSGGPTQVHCELTAVDTLTGQQITARGPTVTIAVLTETRLYYTTSPSTTLMNVGETIVVTSLYGNRGSVTFTNVQIFCNELGRGVLFGIARTPVQSTLPPGWSLSAQETWVAARSGFTIIQCTLNATESSNGTVVTLPAPLIYVTVR
jgi:hypothetical protein